MATQLRGGQLKNGTVSEVQLATSAFTGALSGGGGVAANVVDSGITNGMLAGSIAASKFLNNDFPGVSNSSADGAAYPLAARRADVWKTVVRLATAAALPAYTRSGNTITADANGALTVDGVAVVVGNRILLQNGAAGADNGIYIATAGGNGSNPYILDRAADFDSTGDVSGGAVVQVLTGTANAGLIFACGGVANLNTSAITFNEQFAGGAGLTKTNGALAVGGTSNRIDVAADAVDISANYVGQTSITTLGTIGTGTWHGTAIEAAYLPALNGITAPTGDVSMNSHKITSLATPSADGDAATKAYVDAVAVGIDWKPSVRVVASSALAAYTRNGNVITADANGALADIDGVTLTANDRLLLTAGAAGADNGIYTVTVVGDAGNRSVLTRATDADASAEVTAGLAVWVTEGGTYSDTGWVLTTNDAITLNTTSLTFTQFTGASTITAGAGLTKTGNTIDAVAGDTSIVVNADELHVNLATSSGLDVSSGLRISTAAAGSGIGGGGGSALFLDWVREAPSGAIDGANTSYSLTGTPAPTASLQLFQNGQLLEPAGADYTLSGTTITMATAPVTGDVLTACYAK